MSNFHPIILTLFLLIMLSSCGDSDLLHSTFHLPSSTSEDGTSLGTIDDSIKSSHAAYKGIVSLVSTIFDDAETQTKYIMCATFRIYQLSENHGKNTSFFRSFQRIMKKQSLVAMRSDQDQNMYLMVPMANKYADLEPWNIGLATLMDEQGDIASICDETFYRAIPNSLKARHTENKVLVTYISLALKRLTSLKENLLDMEDLGSTYTSFETALMKIKHDEQDGLSNPIAVKEKIKSYNTFLKSEHNKLPSMSENMPIESSVTKKDVATLMKLFH